MVSSLSLGAMIVFLLSLMPLAAPAASEKTASKDPCKPQGATQLLLEFFGPAAESSKGTEPDKEREQLMREEASRLGFGIEFLVATIPEPDLGFDGAVAALTTAVQQAEYALDRSWLPWRPMRDRKPEDRQETSCQERFPGVLLFRHIDVKKEAKQSLLLVFLVGETPTAGVHKSAFAEALAEIDRLNEPLCDRREIRILGPSFSGSAPSLQMALRQRADLDFRIVSGRATRCALKKLLERVADVELGQTIKFAATVIPDEVLLDVISRHLVDHMGADNHNVALVTESSTDYGQAAEHLSQKGRESEPQFVPMRPQVEDECDQDNGKAKDSGDENIHPRLILPVPLHISRLGRAWENGLSKLPTEKETAQRDGLRQDLGSAAHGDFRVDGIPNMSPGALQSEERALATILTTIFAERIRYVGLVLTDPQDKIFLATQIRKYCPDVVLFTFESDLLYTLPEHKAAMRGMIIVSTYSLFTRDQQWSSPFQGSHHRLQFAHGTDQGLYNAAVVLLNRPELLLEYSRPFLLPGERPNEALRPPVWITAVGIDGLYPLRVESDLNYPKMVYPYNPSRQERKEIHKPPYFPYEQGVLTLTLTLLGIFSVLSCLTYIIRYYSIDKQYPHKNDETALRSKEKDERPYALGRFFEIYRQRASNQQQQLGYIFVVFLSLIISQAFLTAIYFVQFRDGNLESTQPNVTGLATWLELRHWEHLPFAYGLSRTTMLLALLSSGCVALLLGVLLDIAANLFRLGRAESHRKLLSWKRGVLAVTVLGALIFRGFHMLVNSLQTDPNHLLFLRRAAQMGSGLSPVVPFVLLWVILHCYAYQGLYRLFLLDRLSLLRPNLPGQLKISSRIEGEAEAIGGFLAANTLWPLLACPVLAVLAMMFIFGDVVTLEGKIIDPLFRALLAAVAVAILYSAYRFYMLWAHFRHFLHLLSNHKLRDAFDRMPAGLARSVGLQLLYEVPELKRCSILKQHWRVLVSHARQLNLDSVDTLLDQGSMMTELLRAIQLVPSGASHVEEALIAEKVPTVLAILNIYWGARPLRGTIPGEKPLDGRSEIALATANTAELYTRFLPDALHLWLRLAEDFIAIQCVAFMNYLFPQLRNALAFLTSAMVLLMVAISAYPFQPQHLLSLLAWVMVLGVAGLCIWIFVQMERDEILSRIAKTEPGKIDLNWQFVSWVLAYGLVPILGLIATQVPEVRGWLFSWVEPALRALK